MYRLIVRETNRYAGQEQRRLAKPLGWIELTVNKLHMWLGLYFAMGIVQKPSLQSYWEKEQVTVAPSFGNIVQQQIYEHIAFYTFC